MTEVIRVARGQERKNAIDNNKRGILVRKPKGERNMFDPEPPEKYELIRADEGSIEFLRFIKKAPKRMLDDISHIVASLPAQMNNQDDRFNKGAKIGRDLCRKYTDRLEYKADKNTKGYDIIYRPFKPKVSLKTKQKLFSRSGESFALANPLGKGVSEEEYRESKCFDVLWAIQTYIKNGILRIGYAGALFETATSSEHFIKGASGQMQCKIPYEAWDTKVYTAELHISDWYNIEKKKNEYYKAKIKEMELGLSKIVEGSFKLIKYGNF